MSGTRQLAEWAHEVGESVGIDDAPAGMSNAEAHAWASGFSTAMDRVYERGAPGPRPLGLNRRVRVRLRRRGRLIVGDSAAETWEGPIWELMAKFGDHMYEGADPPFEEMMEVLR